MSDLGLVWENGKADILLNANGDDLQQDFDLKTAVVVSLFSDARAATRDLPSIDADPRGWWNAEIGSLLWLLSREKTIPVNLEKGIVYIRNALNWLIEQGIASKIDVSGAIENQYRFKFQIRILKSLDSRYDYLWKDIQNQSYEFDRSKFFITYN